MTNTTLSTEQVIAKIQYNENPIAQSKWKTNKITEYENLKCGSCIAQNRNRDPVIKED
jgi:hypothetical protein